MRYESQKMNWNVDILLNDEISKVLFRKKKMNASLWLLVPIKSGFI